MALFDKAEYLERLAKVKASMSKKGIDVLLVADPANQCYLTGHNAWSFYVPQIVAVAMDDEMPLFFGRFMDTFVGVPKTTWLDKEHIHAYSDDYVQTLAKHPMDHMARLLAELGYGKKTFGVETDSYYFTVRSFESLKKGLPDAKFADGDLIVNWVKLIKSDKEIEMIRRAGTLASKAMAIGTEMIRPGVRQSDVAAAIVGAMVAGTEDFGGEIPSVVPLMPCGDTAGAPHLSWNESRFPENITLYVEIAGCYQRYHCPMSRTVSIGPPPPHVVETVKITTEGLFAALEAVKPGIACEEVEAAWRKTVAKYGIKKESRIGYSIGMTFPPDWGERTVSLRAGDKTVLQPNMTFHCVPGMYYSDYGVTISQCIRVTETGHEKMSDFPFDLIVNT